MEHPGGCSARPILPRIVDDAVPGYDFDAVSGADYRIDLTKPLGARITALGVNGRAVLRLVPAAAGQIRFDGADVATLRGRALRDYRRAVQIVFQDPDNTLDPRMRIGPAIAAPSSTNAPPCCRTTFR